MPSDPLRQVPFSAVALTVIEKNSPFSKKSHWKHCIRSAILCIANCFMWYNSCWINVTALSVYVNQEII